MKKILVIANPASDNGRTVKVIGPIRQALIKKRVNFDLFITSRPGHATELAEKARKKYSDMMVVGGDGTLNEVVNGLGKSSIPVGLVCTGSGNDFGKNIIQGRNIEEQIDVAIGGKIKKIDVGLCNGRYFINGVGIGFDGKVVEQIMLKGKRWKGHWVYLSVVLKLLFTYREPVMIIKTKEKSIDQKVFLITVANGTTFGGGFKLTPDALLDDGLFDVCLIDPLNIAMRYKNYRTTLTGEHIKLDVVRIFRTKEIIIESPEEVFAHMDGEFIGGPPFHIKLLPSFLKIRIPG
ncbi:MAG: diacylglycerol kinase family lipid kinase [Spirochaetes bacterium]|nr:diacylglycerol kinase family lipid kinase [Spirochaetota bacterium]